MKYEFHCLVDSVKTDESFIMDSLSMVNDPDHTLFPIAHCYRDCRKNWITAAKFRGNILPAGIKNALVTTRFNVPDGGHVWAYDDTAQMGYHIRVTKVGNVVTRFTFDPEDPTRNSVVNTTHPIMFNGLYKYDPKTAMEVSLNLRVIDTYLNFHQSMKQTEPKPYVSHKDQK